MCNSSRDDSSADELLISPLLPFIPRRANGVYTGSRFTALKVKSAQKIELHDPYYLHNYVHINYKRSFLTSGLLASLVQVQVLVNVFLEVTFGVYYLPGLNGCPTAHKELAISHQKRVLQKSKNKDV